MIWKRWRAKLEQHIRRHPGQSLVEFTILLPVLLIMISGLIEFGFMLNYYLDLIDAARESARWAAGDDPIRCDATCDPLDAPCLACLAAHPVPPHYTDVNPGFYSRVGSVAESSIDTGSGGQISLDPSVDEIVMSAWSVTGGSVDTRYPTIFLDDGHCRFGYNPVTSATCNHTSQITSAEVNALLDPSAPNTGVVAVEIWYDYNMILGLPWITAFVPNPVTLYAYSIMPNSAVEPTPTPP